MTMMTRFCCLLYRPALLFIPLLAATALDLLILPSTTCSLLFVTH
jgi:hypothetical protein